MKAAKATQQAERNGSKRRNNWLTTIHPRASRDGALLDASPDICHRVTLTLVSRTSTQTLPHDQKFPIDAKKMNGAWRNIFGTAYLPDLLQW